MLLASGVQLMLFFCCCFLFATGYCRFREGRSLYGLIALHLHWNFQHSKLYSFQNRSVECMLKIFLKFQPGYYYKLYIFLKDYVHEREYVTKYSFRCDHCADQSNETATWQKQIDTLSKQFRESFLNFIRLKCSWFSPWICKMKILVNQRDRTWAIGVRGYSHNKLPRGCGRFPKPLVSIPLS